MYFEYEQILVLLDITIVVYIVQYDYGFGFLYDLLYLCAFEVDFLTSRWFV